MTYTDVMFIVKRDCIFENVTVEYSLNVDDRNNGDAFRIITREANINLHQPIGVFSIVQMLRPRLSETIY